MIIQLVQAFYSRKGLNFVFILCCFDSDGTEPLQDYFNSTDLHLKFIQKKKKKEEEEEEEEEKKKKKQQK